ncbi:MAG: hypothetical protein K9L75_04835 [Spirochaetia bacterium]|nr:hypothetical protein [Spirochaetia bacterium]
MPENNKKYRINIPKKIKEKVLKEFSNQCAICKKSSPELHHIDENPNNNDENNLIPLCPNCHSNYAHNPNKQFSEYKLFLFRKYRNRVVFSQNFEPLLSRSRFILESTDSYNKATIDQYKDLLKFIESFNNGNYYTNKLKELLDYHKYVRAVFSNSKNNFETSNNKELLEFIENVRLNKDEAIKTIIEMAAYQGWQNNSDS